MLTERTPRIVTPEDLLVRSERLGSDDDTQTMQRVFDRFGRSDALLLAINKVYATRGTLVARNWDGKVLAGTGGFIRHSPAGVWADDSPFGMLWFRNCTDVDVLGLSLRGARTQSGRLCRSGPQHAVYVTGTDGLQIVDVKVECVVGDAFRVASHDRDRTYAPSRNIEIANCTVTTTGRAGVCADGFQGLMVRDCHFTNVAAPVLLVEAGRRPKLLGPLTFKSNRLDDCRPMAVRLTAGGHMRVESICIERNVTRGKYGFGVAVLGLGGCPGFNFLGVDVIGNTWTSSEAPAQVFRFRDAAAVTVRGNAGPVRNKAYLAWNPLPDVPRSLPFVANCIGITAGPNNLYLRGKENTT